MKKINLSIVFLLILIPSISWSYTYDDVLNFLDENPAPEGCFNWVEEIATISGNGVRVWQRCGGAARVYETYYYRYADINNTGSYDPRKWKREVSYCDNSSKVLSEPFELGVYPAPTGTGWNLVLHEVNDAGCRDLDTLLYEFDTVD